MATWRSDFQVFMTSLSTAYAFENVGCFALRSTWFILTPHANVDTIKNTRKFWYHKTIFNYVINVHFTGLFNMTIHVVLASSCILYLQDDRGADCSVMTVSDNFSFSLYYSLPPFIFTSILLHFAYWYVFYYYMHRKLCLFDLHTVNILSMFKQRQWHLFNVNVDRTLWATWCDAKFRFLVLKYSHRAHKGVSGGRGVD